MKIRTFFKQLFCSHIWKTDEQIDLGSFHVIDSSGGLVCIVKFKKHASKQHCLKCDRKRIKEYQDFLGTEV